MDPAGRVAASAVPGIKARKRNWLRRGARGVQCMTFRRPCWFSCLRSGERVGIVRLSGGLDGILY